jgi:hypothetical protein
MNAWAPEHFNLQFTQSVANCYEPIVVSAEMSDGSALPSNLFTYTSGTPDYILIHPDI